MFLSTKSLEIYAITAHRCGAWVAKCHPDEAVELESALAKLRAPQRIVVLHYSPIRDTVVGEPPEIFAFLGSSRLAEPLNRYAVTAVFHGHAHHGTPEGHTTGGSGLQCRGAAAPQDVSRPPAVSSGRDSSDAAI